MVFLFGSSPLTLGARAHKLVEKGDVLGLQAVLLDPDTGTAEQRRSCLQEPNRQGRTPLMVAASKGNYAMAKLLIQAGTNIHHMVPKGSNNGTALHESTASGSEQIAKMLIDVGCDPFLENLKGFTSLDLAINRGDAPMVRCFEQRALFVGWLFLKANRYQGLSRAWKPRWVSIFRHRNSTYSTLQMHVYKSIQSFKPAAIIRVDGARARMVLREAENAPQGTLQCLATLPPGGPAPGGLAVQGDLRVGWSFEVRPVCRHNASAEARQAAWGVVEEFCNTLNNPPVVPPPRRRATTELGAIANPSTLASTASLLVPSPTTRSYSISGDSAAQVGGSMSAQGHMRSASMYEATSATRGEETFGAMSDEELAMWLQECYSRGESTPPRYSQRSSRLADAEEAQQEAGPSAVPAAASSGVEDPERSTASDFGLIAGAQDLEAGQPSLAEPPISERAAGDSSPSAPPMPEHFSDPDLQESLSAVSLPETARLSSSSAQEESLHAQQETLPETSNPMVAAPDAADQPEDVQPLNHDIAAGSQSDPAIDEIPAIDANLPSTSQEAYLPASGESTSVALNLESRESLASLNSGEAWPVLDSDQSLPSVPVEPPRIAAPNFELPSIEVSPTPLTETPCEAEMPRLPSSIASENPTTETLPSVPALDPAVATLPSAPQHAPIAPEPPARVPVAAGVTVRMPLQKLWDRKGKAPVSQTTGDDDSERLCIICFERPKVAGFVHGDSAHQCVCQVCAKKIMKQKNPRCPLCRSKIQHVVYKFYTS